MNEITDTIAAIATPPGQGGIGVVRVSGPLSKKIAQQILGFLPKARKAHYCQFHDQQQQLLDHGIALFFPGPNSFTGEDVLELQGHGGPVLLDLILKTCVVAGARLARPGEFSEQAYLNGKMDLAQAEAIADLISCQSEHAARAALRSLEGEFSQCIHALLNKLIYLRMYVEATIDFPEEEIDFLSDGKVAALLQDLLETVERIEQAARQGSLLREGMIVVIAGQPNAGKSSLLNALSGREAAIVTDIAGTTRDILREEIIIDGLPIHIIDTAGLRESDDPIEREGIRRAREMLQKADHVLLVMDVTKTDAANIRQELQSLQGQLPSAIPCTVILNKQDLLSLEKSAELVQGLQDFPHIKISAVTKQGLLELRDYLKKCVAFDSQFEGGFLARRRHLDALRRAREAIFRAQKQLVEYSAGELIAEELMLAQQDLAEITGEFHSDDLLGKIFSSFCIGK